MSSEGAGSKKSNCQQVQDALVTYLEADEYANGFRYFQASDVADVDPSLSSTIVGSYLTDLAFGSPLSNGLVVESYTERRCGPSLWIVREAESPSE